jgi:prepilin-type N-terminal cleavage/methylation domain-containing protein
MFTKVKKVVAWTEREAGFTLVELLIVILIVGILSAVALPLYLGYTKDARLAEGKAVGGRPGFVGVRRPRDRTTTAS